MGGKASQASDDKKIDFMQHVPGSANVDGQRGSRSNDWHHSKSTIGRHGNVIFTLLVIIFWKVPDILPRAEACQ